MLKVGDRAPEFTLPDQDGRPVSLRDFAGKTVVLYFYPRASTPGCTAQACSIRNHAAEYAELQTVVLGVSTDPVPRVKRFHTNQQLNFPLLADAGKVVAKAYGALPKVLGLSIPVASRTTFVIAPNGVISHVFERVNPSTHDAMVLDALSSSGR